MIRETEREKEESRECCDILDEEEGGRAGGRAGQGNCLRPSTKVSIFYSDTIWKSVTVAMCIIIRKINLKFGNVSQ